MKCPKCQFDNREGAKFCTKCGLKLKLKCPDCGNGIQDGDVFCAECGHDLKKQKDKSKIDYSIPQSYTPKFLADMILTTRSSIEGEHKQVTVLFADVAGFTAISERIDPEEVHQLMDGAFRILMNEIHKYEGTINQFTGDGVMALFGAPVSHENHSQRACLAALAIRKAIKSYGRKIKNEFDIDFSMRIGLNAGPVVVGSIGDDLRMDYTAIGDTTNLASRLEGIATPGAVLVSEHVYHMTRDFFEFNPVGKIQIKGKKEPVDAYELEKTSKHKTRLEAAIAKGLKPFVGRNDEMILLERLFARARVGQAQVVGIVGEAGVGKSRVLIEFLRSLSPGKHTYLEGCCFHYGGFMSYLPILDILRSCFELKEIETETSIKEKIAHRVLDLDNNLQDVIPPLQHLLSCEVDDDTFLKTEPQQLREKIFEALKNLFVRVSQETPLILVVEDLHWIDKTSEDFLSYFIESMANSHILLVLLYRPEYTHQWVNKSYYTNVMINQLDLGSSIELIKSILKDGGITDELKDIILDRTAGNPLFMEEMTCTLLENGSIYKKNNQYSLSQSTTSSQIPDTVQEIIAARMDRIEQNLKQTMQVASVIGKDFAYRVLKAISDIQEDVKPQLLNLQVLEFIYEKQLFPELEYIFKHGLTQEVAYQSLLGQRRKELHRKVGMAIEELFSERIEEFVSMLGEHFLRGEEWQKAFTYLLKAGDAAAQQYAQAEARQYYSKALEALSHLSQTEENTTDRVDTLLKLVSMSSQVDKKDQNLERLSEAKQLAEALLGVKGIKTGDPLRLARVDYWTGRVHYASGSMVEAMRYYHRVLEVASGLKDPELLAIPSLSIGIALWIQGDFQKAGMLISQALRPLEKMGNWTDWVRATVLYGGVLGFGGDYQGGLEQMKRGLARAEDIGIFPGIAISNALLAGYYVFGGDYQSAIGAARQSVEAAEKSGDKLCAHVGYGWLGWAQGLSGDSLASADNLAQSQAVARDLGGTTFMADWFAAARAEIAFCQGHIQEALALAEKAVEMAQHLGASFGEGLARRTWGQALGALTPPRFDEAEEQMAISLRVLESGSALLAANHTRVAWGTLCYDRGDFASAREHWDRAAAQWEGSGMSRNLELTRSLIAKL